MRTTSEGEEILHRVLWQIVEEESQRSAAIQQGWFNPAVVAMVFAFHTVEAYMNYVGERLAPEIWKDERNYFRKEPYRGWDGKLRKVMDLVGLSLAPEDRPLKTILELRDVRDLIAHGKAEKLTGEVAHPAGTEAPAPVSTVRQMVIPEGKLGAALADVEQFLNQIHQLARTKVDVSDVWFGVHPLRGPSEYVVRSTTLQSEQI
ncbi:MAG: hypothetical protein WB755_24655 [Terriglobales bacterium]